MSGLPPFNTRARILSLIAIFSSVFGVGLVIGFSIPLISLFMGRLGYSSTQIGLNAATAALTILCMGPFVAGFASRLGTVSTLLLGHGLAAAGLFVFPFFSSAGPLFLLRALIGFGSALSWIVSETWISALPPSERWRGRVIAAYAVVFGSGLSLGPLLLYAIGTEGVKPFMSCAILLGISGLPAALVYRYAPAISQKNQRVRIVYALRLAPVGILAAFLCGFAEQSLLGMLPLWCLEIAFTAPDAVLLTNMFALGGVLLMVPVGWLADRMDRFKLLVGMVALGALCTSALPWMIDLPSLLFSTVLVLGGTVAAFYTLGLVLIGETSVAREADLVSLNTVFIMAYTAGMVVGPVLAGAGMDTWPQHGLMIVLVALFVAFIPAAYWFRR